MLSLRMVTLSVFALLVGGCSNDCEDACEGAKECPFTAGFIGDVSCADACDLQEQQAEATGCVSQWEDYNACTADNLGADCGASGNFCLAENAAYFGCLEPQVP